VQAAVTSGHRLGDNVYETAVVIAFTAADTAPAGAQPPCLKQLTVIEDGVVLPCRAPSFCTVREQEPGHHVFEYYAVDVSGNRSATETLRITIVDTAPPSPPARPAPTTFVATLSAAEEVPRCAQAGPEARGVAVFQVLDRATGLVSYRLVANNLPGTITAAHIHITPPDPGPIVQPLSLTPSATQGVIGEGTFTNRTLLAALQAHPQDYYVNVHTSVCPSGVIRGQLGEQGPGGQARP